MERGLGFVLKVACYGKGGDLETVCCHHVHEQESYTVDLLSRPELGLGDGTDKQISQYMD